VSNLGIVPSTGIITLDRSPTGSNPDPKWVEARLITDVSYLIVDGVKLKLKLTGEPDTESALVTKQGLIYLHPSFIGKPYILRYAYIANR